MAPRFAGSSSGREDRNISAQKRRESEAKKANGKKPRWSYRGIQFHLLRIKSGLTAVVHPGFTALAHDHIFVVLLVEQAAHRALLVLLLEDDTVATEGVVARPLRIVGRVLKVAIVTLDTPLAKPDSLGNRLKRGCETAGVVAPLAPIAHQQAILWFRLFTALAHQTKGAPPPPTKRLYREPILDRIPARRVKGLSTRRTVNHFVQSPYRAGRNQKKINCEQQKKTQNKRRQTIFRVFHPERSAEGANILVNRKAFGKVDVEPSDVIGLVVVEVALEVVQVLHRELLGGHRFARGQGLFGGAGVA